MITWLREAGVDGDSTDARVIVILSGYDADEHSRCAEVAHDTVVVVVNLRPLRRVSWIHLHR